MLLSYRLGDQLVLDTILPALSEAARELGVELVRLESAPVDLYFFAEAEALPERTGLKILVTKSPQRMGADVQFSDALEIELARVLLSWTKERKVLIEVGLMRHQLGNLIVILIGRIMQMKKNVDQEHLSSLEQLHQRLCHLFEAMNNLPFPTYQGPA